MRRRDDGVAGDPTRDAHGVDVVVIDDEVLILRLMERLLHPLGYRTRCFATGHEALGYLRSAPSPGLILLDLQMDGLSGWELAAELRRDPDLALLNIAIISGCDTATQAAERLEAVACLTKPFDVDRVRETVQRYCSRRNGRCAPSEPEHPCAA